MQDDPRSLRYTTTTSVSRALRHYYYVKGETRQEVPRLPEFSIRGLPVDLQPGTGCPCSTATVQYYQKWRVSDQTRMKYREAYAMNKRKAPSATCIGTGQPFSHRDTDGTRVNYEPGEPIFYVSIGKWYRSSRLVCLPTYC